MGGGCWWVGLEVGGVRGRGGAVRMDFGYGCVREGWMGFGNMGLGREM